MFFSKPGEHEPCGIFSVGHFILFFITITSVAVSLFFTRKIDNSKIKAIIKKSTFTLWILELIKIIFNLLIGNIRNPNNYVPLYYCSLILYMGLFSSFCRGKLKRVGDVFIATGSIIGGLFFLIYPNTSLPMYPPFHYISVQSFIFHGTMLYLGILVNVNNYIDLSHRDIKYYATVIAIMSAISYMVNKVLGTNFMFISSNFPNTPIEIVYNHTGVLFTPIMILIQAVGPFYVIYYVRKLFKNRIDSKMQMA